MISRHLKMRLIFSQYRKSERRMSCLIVYPDFHQGFDYTLSLDFYQANCRLVDELHP